MDLGLQGKMALVTGGGRGIGRAIALALAREGVNVAIAGRDPEPRTLEEISALGVKAAGLRVDVSSESQAGQMVREAIRILGSLDLYVSNAGAHFHEPVTKLTTQNWMKTLDTNLSACMWACREVAKHMIARRSGSILIVVSTIQFNPAYKETRLPGGRSEPLVIPHNSHILYEPHGRSGSCCSFPHPSPARGGLTTLAAKRAPMKVIVTGGSGKAARYVVRELVQAGREVTNLDSVPLDGLAGTLIRVDLTDAGEVYDAFAQARPEGVCHLAANPSPGGWSRQGTFLGNVAQTYHVMQAAGDFGVRRFIYASSEMATGWLTTEQLPSRFPFNEEDRVDSPNAYALSKYLGEIMADSFALRYPEMAICSLRINNVIPPEQSEAILGARRRGFPGPGSSNFRSYIDARDVGSAFRAALEGQSSGHEVLLIAAADTCIEVPIREAIRIRFGKEVAFAPGHGDFRSVVDCSKMKRFFGWTPRHSWRDAG